MQILPIPSTGYLRLYQIIGDKKRHIPAIIPVSRTTWLEGVKSGLYPASIQLSARTVAWKVEDILELIATLGGTSTADNQPLTGGDSEQ